MSVQLVALSFDANDPAGLARFWAGVLGRELVGDRTTVVFVLLPSDDTGFRLEFAPTQEPKTGPNQIHFDLTSHPSTISRQTVARPLELGGRQIDIGQGPDADHVVWPTPRATSSASSSRATGSSPTTALIGALSCDGTQQVGYFWSPALGWPLVWDQDEETAIQSPHGGSMISLGWSARAPKTGKNRLHLDVAPLADADQEAEVERLVSLGATRIDIGQGDVAGSSWPIPTATSSAS